jgi:hypothetical protein
MSNNLFFGLHFLIEGFSLKEKSQIKQLIERNGGKWSFAFGKEVIVSLVISDSHRQLI